MLQYFVLDHFDITNDILCMYIVAKHTLLHLHFTNSYPVFSDHDFCEAYFIHMDWSYYYNVIYIYKLSQNIAAYTWLVSIISNK
jgi:hypothetical protein